MKEQNAKIPSYMYSMYSGKDDHALNLNTLHKVSSYSLGCSSSNAATNEEQGGVWLKLV